MATKELLDVNDNLEVNKKYGRRIPIVVTDHVYEGLFSLIDNGCKFEVKPRLETEVNTLRETISYYYNVIDELEKTVRQKDETISELDKAVEKKDELITSLEDQLHEQDNIMFELEGRIIQLEGEINNG